LTATKLGITYKVVQFEALRMWEIKKGENETKGKELGTNENQIIVLL
jgi:hypothetical protein